MRIINDVPLLVDFKDKAGRIYDRAELTEQIRGREFLGELGHRDDMKVNLERVSHSVDDIMIDDTGMRGTIKVLDTPAGKIVESLINSGVNLTTSIRAIGMVNEDMSVYDVRLITFDLVGEEI